METGSAFDPFRPRIWHWAGDRPRTRLARAKPSRVVALPAFGPLRFLACLAVPLTRSRGGRARRAGGMALACALAGGAVFWAVLAFATA